MECEVLVWSEDKIMDVGCGGIVLMWEMLWCCVDVCVCGRGLAVRCEVWVLSVIVMWYRVSHCV